MVGHLTRGRRYSTITLTLIQAVVGAVIFTAADVPGLVHAVTNFGWAAWLGVLYLGLACSVFAFLAQMWAIRRTSAARASLLMGTEPVWAVLAGVTIGAETLGIVGGIGAVLIIASTFWGQRVEAAHRARVDTAEPRHPLPVG
ncbi:DMT family transporter [Cryobacterium sp. MLB-32]|uniref:DMT family transporter n=1 Tax=Cryobacterium sp. MLB-32 TaxID=1529318 RepID=UPI000A5C4842|nr:DMT family transporter [Cryobacterium sp. MLB-32]